MSTREIKLCLLGESGVGKSSIVYRFVYDSFRAAMESTIGASFMTKTMVVEGRSFKFQIWDTAGQEKYRALAPMYYRGAAAAIVVYDITRESSFGTLRSWINELNKHGPPNIVLAIAGNKVDLQDEMREVQYRDAQAYAENVGAVLVETSAKTASNISALFYEICKKLIASEELAVPNTTATGGMTLDHSTDNAEQSKRKCCGS